MEESTEKHLIGKDTKNIMYKDLEGVDISFILKEFNIHAKVDKNGSFLITPLSEDKFLATIVKEQQNKVKKNKNIWNNFMDIVDRTSKEPADTSFEAYTVVNKSEPKNFMSKFYADNNKMKQKEKGAFSPVHNIYTKPPIVGLYKKADQIINRDVLSFISDYAQISEVIMDDVARNEDILSFLATLGPSLRNLKMYISTSKDFKRLYKDYKERGEIEHAIDEMEVGFDPSISDTNDQELYNVIKVFADLGLQSALLNDKSVNLYITLALVSRDRMDKELKSWGDSYVSHLSKKPQPNVVFYIDIYEFNFYAENTKYNTVNPNRTEISTKWGPVQVMYHQNLKK